jgi:tetratricopeptide (TPR) repeat protein
VSNRPDRHKRKSDDKRRRETHESGQRKQHRTVTSVSSGQLPKWVREEIQRSTPKDRRDPALNHLAKALNQFADERYTAALPELRKAKQLAPRSSTVREMLGLSAYRTGQWEEALRELRTFRRITGDVIHVPVEMDCLRALERPGDVTKTWNLLLDLDTPATVGHEARVVYASFLLDQGKPREAWQVIKPGRLVASPSPGELRRWYVAAKVALEAGDKDAARRIVAALDEQEPDFEGVEELRAVLL